jgi:hypothetical protein
MKEGLASLSAPKWIAEKAHAGLEDDLAPFLKVIDRRALIHDLARHFPTRT